MLRNKLDLHEIQNIAFDILKHFKRFCEENDIQYFLSNGTLLGAIKYKGFIPWDDDIDVFVPREDYNRLIKIYKDNARYKLFSLERTSKYRFTFAKLCDMSTRKVEENIDNGIDLGVEIDIFPLDSCTSHMLERKTINRFKGYQMAYALSKFQSSYGRPIHKRCVIEYCRYKGHKYFEDKINRLVSAESDLGDSYRGCLVWPVYGEREIIPAEVFSDVIEVEFEGESFRAPVGYDIYLRSLYGDYEKDPPLEKQKTHHKFEAFRIS